MTERMNIMEKLKVILIGAGGRGTTYTNIMAESPEKFQVIAVAEPVEARREAARKKHNIPEEMCFTTWEPLLEMEKFADIAVIATMDRLHYAPTMAAIEKGYNLLLEKPVTPTPEECYDIAKAAEKKGVKILVCHVLRYTLFGRTLKKLIKEGLIGDVVSIHADECVNNIHQSHSFVRGNWGNEHRSSTMLLQKCCHDMDFLQWLMNKEVKRVHSFGSTMHFKRENAPEGSPEYCIEGCPHKDTCFYDATVIYNKEHPGWYKNHALRLENPTDADYENLLRNTQYGKCVYKCDNTVVDHQVVNLEFEDGATISFNMNAFNKGGRHMRIMGTKGELYGDASETSITHYDFATQKTENLNPSDSALGDAIDSGHGGGDAGIVEVLYEYLTKGYEGDLLSEISVSAKNHMIAFAAEESRVTGKVVDVQEFTKKYAE